MVIGSRRANRACGDPLLGYPCALQKALGALRSRRAASGSWAMLPWASWARKIVVAGSAVRTAMT
eukprot:7906312-Alexandrium_andersonii.AAC.1